MITLVAIQVFLDVSRSAFLLFMPPVGFALFLLAMFGIQPVILGVLNIIVIHRLHNCEDWEIGFWLNGVFLLLVFTTINLVIETFAGVPFSWILGVPEIFLLAYPFGYLAQLSNRGRKKLQVNTNTVSAN
jgi:hypothetical protein